MRECAQFAGTPVDRERIFAMNTHIEFPLAGHGAQMAGSGDQQVG